MFVVFEHSFSFRLNEYCAEMISLYVNCDINTVE